MLNAIKVSPHFSLREFQCRGRNCCGGAVKVDSELLERLEQLRVRLGKPVMLSCGYRCPQHNEAVGGTPNSFHMQGIAADVRTTNLGMSPLEVARMAREVGFTGVGVYDGYHGKRGFVHVDVRSVASPDRIAMWGDWGEEVA